MSAALFGLASPFAAGCSDAGGEGGERAGSSGDALVRETLAGPGAQDIAWQECGTTYKGECATIRVPVDWDHPEGETFELAIGRVKALEPQNRIGVLLVNPGGPGASGIDRYTIGRRITDDSLLRKRFDIVTWDPRGVARSHPVQCDKELLGQAPSTYPKTQQEYKNLLAYNTKLGADCRARTGPLFDHVDTVSTVRDLDAIRAALGEETISFLGWSYGTQVGQQYAELFPQRVRAMTIDSNMDHSNFSAYEYMRSATEDFEESFYAFADWCDRTPACSLHGQDVVQVWDTLHRRAAAGKLIDPQTGKPLDDESLRGNLFSPMYDPARWFTLADRLASLQSGVRSARAVTESEELEENSYQAIWCEDWSWRVGGFHELDSYRRSLAANYPHTKLSRFWSDITACLGWPAKIVNRQHRLSIHGTPTILIVTGRHDVATPHSWNTAVADQIDDSVFLAYDGVGHGQYFHSPCVRDHIETYLTTLKTPAPNTHCPAVWPTTPASTLASEPNDSPRRPVHTP
ncbi:alpha/beta hydrolase [Pendulispora albinea]|uniref:Alpha/beta hydrolase n=1 Tax=Pendulispora albinea TaxID=2741071 RepID=A0ABZ2M6A4_9BACT